MSFIQTSEDMVFGIVQHSIRDLIDCLSGEEIGIGLCQPREYFFLLDLVIQNGHFPTLIVLKLSSGKRVADDDGGSFGEVKEHSSRDEPSGLEHRRISDLLVSNHLILAFLRHFMVSHQHVPSWNPHIIENQIAVVLTVKPKFRSHISHLDPRQRFMLTVPHFYDKSMHTILFALDDQLRKHTGMGRKHSQITNPPLRCLNVRSVHYEGIG